MQTIADQLGDDRPGAKVYDFSNTRRPRRSGHDPSVPQIMITLAVHGKLLVGHTADLRDESAPILIDQAPRCTRAAGQRSCGACGAWPRSTSASWTAPRSRCSGMSPGAMAGRGAGRGGAGVMSGTQRVVHTSGRFTGPDDVVHAWDRADVRTDRSKPLDVHCTWCRSNVKALFSPDRADVVIAVEHDLACPWLRNELSYER